MQWTYWYDIALGLGAALLVLLSTASLRRRRLRAQFRRASAAERAAAALLERRGYRVLEIQPCRTLRFRVGGQMVRAQVRADYLVARWFRRFVVEVKSGAHAPDPASRSTRRQLREYCAVFPYPVLLLDAETGRLSLVEFLDVPVAGGSAGRFLLCLAGWWLLFEAMT